MSDLTLVKNRLHRGVWEGTLTGSAGATPVLVLRHKDEVVPGLTLAQTGKGTWAVSVPVPVDLIDDDFRTFVIVDETRDAILTSFSVFAGDQLSDEMQAEVDLLRAELDLLKRAFRKHCVETT